MARERPLPVGDRRAYTAVLHDDGRGQCAHLFREKAVNAGCNHNSVRRACTWTPSPSPPARALGQARCTRLVLREHSVGAASERVLSDMWAPLLLLLPLATAELYLPSIVSNSGVTKVCCHHLVYPSRLPGSLAPKP